MFPPPNHTRSDSRRRSSNPNVFADEYAVGDHYRDGGVSNLQYDESELEESEIDWMIQPSSSTTQQRQSRNTSGERQSKTHVPRSSTAKVPLPTSQSFLHNEYIPPSGFSTGGINRNSSTHSTITNTASQSVRRSFSSTSSYPLPRSQSPFSAVSGPSHPYGMYPQNTTYSRTVSTRSSSTLRAVPRSLSDNAGPAHPYAMYQQNVFSDPDNESLAEAHGAIPLGFQGREQQHYHRRIGADGEEQDIVGPDGHLEQLPPYTLYPENGIRRPPVAITHRTLPESHIAPSLHSPEPGSLSPSSTVSQTNSTAPLQPLLQESPFADSAASETLRSERRWTEKKSLIKQPWSEVKKKRFCHDRVPFWFVLLGVGFIGLVVGGVAAVIAGIITFKNKHHHHDPPVPTGPTSTVYASSLTDATPIPTPTGIIPLPTGTFPLPLNATQGSNSCLAQANQTDAWTCSTPSSGSVADVSITVEPSGTNFTAIIQQQQSSQDWTWYYGAQPPQFPTTSQALSLVEDDYDTGRGPAYYFQTTYDKVVILNASEAPAAHTKRNIDWRFHPSNTGVLQPLQPNENAWFCYWNQTSIEVFIYDLEDVSASSTASATLTPPVPIPSSTSSNVPSSPQVSSTSTQAPTTIASSYASTPSTMITSSVPAPIPSTSQPPPTTLTSSNQQDSPKTGNGANHRSKGGNGGGNGNGGSGSGAQTSTKAMMARQASASPSTYPRLVKIVEKRLPADDSGITPTCTLMSVSSSGQLQQVQTQQNGGAPVQVVLNLQDRPDPQTSPNLGKRQQLGGENSELCGCQWLSTGGD